jgi:hypothetical protein
MLLAALSLRLVRSLSGALSTHSLPLESLYVVAECYKTKDLKDKSPETRSNRMQQPKLARHLSETNRNPLRLKHHHVVL